MGVFSLAFSFFLLMDSVGNVPIFIAILKGLPIQRQRRIIIRELCIALLVIIAFIFFGDGMLDLLGITCETIQIAGGLILFIIALKMLFPPLKPQYPLGQKQEPFLVPLAIPLVAGPSVLASVMVYSGQIDLLPLIIAVCLAWSVSAIILVLSANLKKWLGERVLAACERLMGLILILIAVEMFLAGFGEFLAR